MSFPGASPPPHLVPPGAGSRRPQLGWRAGQRGPQELARIRPLVPRVLGRLSGEGGPADPRWLASPGVWTSTGTATFLLSPVGGSPAAALRLTATGHRSFQRESEVLTELRSQAATEPIRALLPQRLAAGTVEDCSFALDSFLPGVSAESLIADPSWPPIQLAALGAVDVLHRAFARPLVVDDEVLRHWVDEPLAVLRKRVRRLPGVTPLSRLDRLRGLLTESLAGRSVDVTWVHGDFWAGNLLVDEATRQLTGLVDWDLASPGELPVHDYLHLMVYRRRALSGRELGDVVGDLLGEREPWTAQESGALDEAAWCFHDEPPPARVLLLLQWLRHVAAVSVAQRSYVSHSVLAWELRNVHRVLKAL